MKKETLYLHVGWSKTGTSAIQHQIQAQRDDFADREILYPQSIQWADHSHHPFALSFQGSGAYKSDLTPSEVLDKLRDEMNSSHLDNVLISSELSPFYFDNPHFKRFVDENFKRVEVIFTVRPQSDLLLSLYNQLIKDPNIRFGASVFSLAMNNIRSLDFYKQIMRWGKYVGDNNLAVIPYGKDIVPRFISHFGIEPKMTSVEAQRIVNPSIPTRCLVLVRERGKSVNSNTEFSNLRDRVIEISNNIPLDYDSHILFSAQDQAAFDGYFKDGNEKLIKLFDLNHSDLVKSDYSSVCVLPPDITQSNFV